MTNIVYNMDCMDGLKEYPDGYFDLAVVDPPYFSGPERRGYYGSNISAARTERHYYPVTKKWMVPDGTYFKELFRVANSWIIWGCNYYDIVFPSHGRIIWDKCNGSNSFSDCEIAATNCHESVRLFRYMWNGMCQGKSIKEGGIMQGDRKKKEIRIHPTQKPINLYRWIYQKYAKPGYKILDTHVGSGTSRRAAYEAGLDFVGFEIEPEYFQRQEEAFQEFAAQQSLFVNE